MVEFTAQLAVTIIVQCFLSAYGLLAYIVVLRPLFKFRKTLFSTPFYTVCFALALLDILNLFDRLSLRITDPLLPYISPDLNTVRSFSERCIFYGIACLHLLIAMERALVVLLPIDGKFILSNISVLAWMMFFSICIIVTNFCVLTPICPYIWYPNTTTVFIDLKVSTAVLHNKVVDLSLQPLLLCVTLLVYFVTGFKVIKVKRKIQSQQTLPSNLRKTKLEHILVLQGLIVTIPHLIGMIVYHVLFYCPTLPNAVQSFLEFLFQITQVLGSCLNPILHLLMNKDLRRKAVESWCDHTVSSEVIPSQQNLLQLN